MVPVAGAFPYVLFDGPLCHPDAQAREEASVLTESWARGLDLPLISPSYDQLSFTIHGGDGDKIIAQVVYIPVHKGDIMSEQISATAFAVARAQRLHKLCTTDEKAGDGYMFGRCGSMPGQHSVVLDRGSIKLLLVFIHKLMWEPRCVAAFAEAAPILGFTVDAIQQR